MTKISTSQLPGTPWTPKGDSLGFTSKDYELIGRLFVHGGLDHACVAEALNIRYAVGEALDRPDPHDVYNRTLRASFAAFIAQYEKKGYLALDEHPRQPGLFRFYLRPDFFQRCADGVQATQSEYEHVQHTVAMAIEDFLLAGKADGRADLKDIDPSDLYQLVRVAGDLPPMKLTPEMVGEVAQEMAKPGTKKRAPAQRIQLPDMRPCRLRALREFIRWCIKEYSWNQADWRRTIQAISDLEKGL
jgi:hypothetical protein